MIKCKVGILSKGEAHRTDILIPKKLEYYNIITVSVRTETVDDKT